MTYAPVSQLSLITHILSDYYIAHKEPGFHHASAKNDRGYQAVRQKVWKEGREKEEKKGRHPWVPASYAKQTVNGPRPRGVHADPK